MAYFALLWKARTIEKYRHIYEREKMNSIMLSNSESHKQSLLQKFRHYRYDTRKRVGNLFRKCCPEGSKLGNLIVYLKTDQTFPNFVMKSVIGFVGGIVLTYLCFMFFVFQLAISLVHATIMSSIIGVLLTLGLAFSYRVRCLVFLLIPQFFSKVGRYTLTCYALVLILTGPATNTLRNSEVLSESMACGQEQVKTSVKQITDSIKKPFNSMKDTIKIMIERVKHVATKLKETLLKIHRLVMSIVRVLQSAFSWLSSVVGICNKKVGTPYVRCKRALGDGVLDCQAKLGPYFAWLCNVIYVAEAACWAVRPLDVICILVEFVSGTIVATVKRKLNTFSNHIKTMLYVSVRVHHSYTFSSNSSRSASQVAAGIVTEIRHRAEPLLTWLSWSSCVTSLFLCLIIFRAKYYQHMYETRSRYDNRYVTKELRNLDLKRVREDRETVLPLNRRERAKYVTTTSFRLVASERLYLTRSVVFMGITTFKLLVHMIADYSLYWVLATIRYHGRFQTPQLPGIPDAGVEVAGKGPVAGMVRSLVDSLSVPLTTPVPSPASCLPDPYPPDFQRYMQIGVLIFLLWFFALFEPYGLRLRHVIMGHYRPERAEARAVWLYNHILRTRGGFLKLARRKLHRDYKYNTEERFTFRQWLDANIPCMWLRYLLGTAPKGAHCLLCSTTEHPNDPDTHLIHCETLNCPGIYCASCFSDIGQLCTICLTPRDYGDISDVSLEKGSSEESSDEDSDSPPGIERSRTQNGQGNATNYNSFSDIQPTKKTRSGKFIQKYSKRNEHFYKEPQQADNPNNQHPNDEIGHYIANDNSLGNIQPSKRATTRGSIQKHNDTNDNIEQEPQPSDDFKDDKIKKPDRDLRDLKEIKSLKQLHTVKRKRKLSRLRNFYKVSKIRLKNCIMAKFQKGKTNTRSFKIFKQSKRRRRKKSVTNSNVKISRHRKNSSDDSSENRGTLNMNQDYFKPNTTVKSIYNASTSRGPGDDNNNNNNNPGPSKYSSNKLRTDKRYITIKSKVGKTLHLKWIKEQYMQDIGTTEFDKKQIALDAQNAKALLFKMHKKRKDAQYTFKFKRPNKTPQIITWSQAAIPRNCTCPNSKCFCIGLDEQPYVSLKKKNIPLDVYRDDWLLGMFLKFYRPWHHDPPANTFMPNFKKSLKKEMNEYNKVGSDIKRGPEMCLARCPHYYKNVSQRLVRFLESKKLEDGAKETLYKEQLEKAITTLKLKIGMTPKKDIPSHNIIYKPEPSQVYNKLNRPVAVVNYAHVAYNSSMTTLRKIFKKSNSRHNLKSNIKFEIKSDDIPSTSKQCNVQHYTSLSDMLIEKDTDSAPIRKPNATLKSRRKKKISTISFDFKKKSDFKGKGDFRKKIATIKQNNIKEIKQLLTSDKISKEQLKLMKSTISVFKFSLEYMKKYNNKLADNVDKKIISFKKSYHSNKTSTKEHKNSVNSKPKVRTLLFRKRSEKCNVSYKLKKNNNNNQDCKGKHITKEEETLKKKYLDNICRKSSGLSDKLKKIITNKQKCKEKYITEHNIAKNLNLENIKKHSEKFRISDKQNKINASNESHQGKNNTEDAVKHKMAEKKDLDNTYEKRSEKYSVNKLKENSNNNQTCKGNDITEDTAKHNTVKKKGLDNICEKRSEKCSVLAKLKKICDNKKCKGKNIAEDRVKHNIGKNRELDNICDIEGKNKDNLNMELTHIVVDNNIKGNRYKHKDIKIDMPAETPQRSTAEDNFNNARWFTPAHRPTYRFDEDHYSSVSFSHSECTSDLFGSNYSDLKLAHNSLSGSSCYSDWWSPMTSCVLNVGHYVEERKTVTFSDV